MIVASGFIETNRIEDIDAIVSELKRKDIEVSEIKDDKIVFLIEKETSDEVKKMLDSLKYIEGVRNVYLAYFSLEGSDKE